MKKTTSIFLVLLVVLNLSVCAFATEQLNIGDSSVAERILETAEGIYDSENERGQIVEKKLSLSKTSTQLIIYAKTSGIAEVTKCGFTYIKLQRLISGTWMDYSSYCYYNQYSNSTTKAFSVYASVPKGYTYRVICEHYAEKPRLLFGIISETSYNETPTIYF